MERILVLFTAAMLLAAPAFAAGSSFQRTQTAGNTQAGSQANVTSNVKIKDVTGIAIGESSKINVGNIENNGGIQRNVTNNAKVKDSTAITIGKNSEVKMGTISNQ